MKQLPQRPPCERRYREEHAKLVVEWLRHHYELADSRFTILKATVFHDYLVMCRRTGTESTTAAVFGRFVKRAFPNIRCSRKGLDGRSLHCYRCLKRKSDAAGPGESSPRVAAPAEEDAGGGTTWTTEESSGSDSADDEGYDDELRNTIEELCLAAGGPFVELALPPPPPSTSRPADPVQELAERVAAPVRPETKTGWPEPSSFESRSLSLASIPSFPVLDRERPSARHTGSVDESAVMPNPQPTNQQAVYYPSHGREYLMPCPPAPDSYPIPRYRPMRTYHTSTMDHNPSDSSYYTPTTTSSLLSSHSTTTTTYSAFRPSSALPCHPSPQSIPADQRDGWPIYENDTSMNLAQADKRTYSMDPCADQHTSYPMPSTPQSTWSPGENPPFTFFNEELDEPWSTANPTPYAASVGQEEAVMTQAPSQFRPRLKTQACPVHIQPTTVPPYASYYHPLHMRTT